jgi:hypothetical protein
MEKKISEVELSLLEEIKKLKLELESKSKSDGRKDEVLNIMKLGKVSINVSSQLSYLRKDMKDGKIKVDGKVVVGIGKNSLNKLYLEFAD